MAGLTLATLVVQTVVPWAIFIGPRARAVAVVVLCGHQLGIAATGNFAFFNLLSVVLLLAVVDDHALRVLSRAAASCLVRVRLLTALAGRLSAWTPTVRMKETTVSRRSVAVALVGLAFLPLHAIAVLDAAGLERHVPQVVFDAVAPIQPLYVVNRYGLFTHMTRGRPEVEIEGSDDGVDWKPYTFKYKVGPVDRWPPLVAPHQPRLDWQMWFAALTNVRRQPFVDGLLRGLARGSDDIRSLLAHDPFAPGVPRFVRAVRYEYALSSPDERARTGNVWTREVRGLYAPVVDGAALGGQGKR